ncbi:unnamed protein product [Dibothriocephalus latus]|uniref:MHD domain-containing protein n=1 Tax=Dibothriocephalus latus TaxID=60516 RepID=A0A3P6UFD5_DIBLA|nr:unnamed protein product [Dibothriocephalus latus]
MKDIPPIVECPNGLFLLNVYRNGVFLVAVCAAEVSPLLVLELLNQIVFILEDYYGPLSETVIIDNLVGSFELLDEMLDNGFPMSTESNILKELIKPPKLLRSLTDAVTGRHSGVTSTLPANQLTNIRWRRSGVKYTNNEAFFDITEKINAIVDRSGTVLLADVEGSIDCLVHLSGLPDLTLSFLNAHLLENTSLHPCVRYARWDKQRILSFVPPDGHFRLFSYYIPNLRYTAPPPTCRLPFRVPLLPFLWAKIVVEQTDVMEEFYIFPLALPISLRQSIILKETGSRLDISVTPKSTGGKPLEQVKVTAVLPVEVSNVSVTPSQGKSTFDPVSKTLVWDVSSVPVVSLDFQLPQATVSGLRVARLELHRETYKPFKGVKYLTRAGSFEARL